MGFNYHLDWYKDQNLIAEREKYNNFIEISRKDTKLKT